MKGNRKFLPAAFAAVVALVLAGCASSNSSTGTTTTGGQAAGGVTVTTAASAGPTVVNVVAGEKDGKYFLTVTPASVKAGPTTINLENQGTVEHEVVVLKTDTPAAQLKVGSDHTVSEDASVGEDSETKPGATKSTTIDLTPGSYVLVCNIERHYERGMYAAFSVT